MKKPVLPKFSQECVLCNCNEINDRMDNVCFSEDSITDDLYQQEFFECEFKNVSIHIKMISCLFADVIFDHCDLSNACFSESVFRRCIFRNCRMTGIDFSDCSFTDVTMHDSLALLANLNQTTWKNVEWKQICFQETYFYNVKFKDINVKDCDFTSSEFNQTKLSGIDVSSSNIESIATQPENLKGMIVNREQAVALAQLLGIIVK